MPQACLHFVCFDNSERCLSKQKETNTQTGNMSRGSAMKSEDRPRLPPLLPPSIAAVINYKHSLFSSWRRALSVLFLPLFHVIPSARGLCFPDVRTCTRAQMHFLTRPLSNSSPSHLHAGSASPPSRLVFVFPTL